MVPEVYAGFGAGVSEIDNLNDKSIMSGPNWFYTLTGNAGGVNSEIPAIKDNEWGRTGKGTNWYCLDLLNKYHKKSALKQFHALTFYFRDTRTPSNGAIITSTLPESFSYQIGGVWQNPVQLGGGALSNSFVNAITKGNKSLAFSVDTSLIWQSPKRMDLVFKIPVFDDSGTGTHRNYQEAIELFSEAILPEVGEDGVYNSVPGPNIFTALTYRAKGGKETKAAQTFSDVASTLGDAANKHLYGRYGIWDRISIQVGGLLLLDWCVIKDLKVTFPNTKAQVLHDYRKRTRVVDEETGDLISNEVFKNNENKEESLEGNLYDYKVHLQPIQAELEITVSTVMGMTRATFKDMLYQNPSEFSGGEASNKTYKKGLDRTEQTMRAA